MLVGCTAGIGDLRRPIQSISIRYWYLFDVQQHILLRNVQCKPITYRWESFLSSLIRIEYTPRRLTAVISIVYSRFLRMRWAAFSLTVQKTLNISDLATHWIDNSKVLCVFSSIGCKWLRSTVNLWKHKDRNWLSLNAHSCCCLGMKHVTCRLRLGATIEKEEIKLFIVCFRDQYCDRMTYARRLRIQRSYFCDVFHWHLLFYGQVIKFYSPRYSPLSNYKNRIRSPQSQISEISSIVNTKRDPLRRQVDAIFHQSLIWWVQCSYWSISAHVREDI